MNSGRERHAIVALSSESLATATATTSVRVTVASVCSSWEQTAAEESRLAGETVAG